MEMRGHSEAVRGAIMNHSAGRSVTARHYSQGDLLRLKRSALIDLEKVIRQIIDGGDLFAQTQEDRLAEEARVLGIGPPGTSNVVALAKLWQFTPSDKLIHALPVYHTHGLFVAINTVFVSGGQLLFRRKFDVDDIVRLLPQATALMGVPTFYTRLLQHKGLTREATKHMRLFVSGSAPLLAETHREFLERTGHAVLERYGMTETNMNTSNPYGGERRAGTVGMALPGTEVRVCEGGIEVKGLNVFKGYWRNPEKTKAEFTTDGFFMTGDLGHFDEKGYLVISGRAKDLIITGGFNVYPKEVEELIDAMSGVLESAVIGLPDSDFGEVVTAVVVAKKGVALSEAEITKSLKQNLAGYKCPKRVIIVDELPRNTMGKVQKNILRQTYGPAPARPV